MKTIDQWLAEYQESHQNKTNKLFHWVCVPIIMWTVIALLWSIPHDYLSTMIGGEAGTFFNWATIAMVLASMFYLRLSFTMFLGMTLVSVVMLIATYFIAQLTFAPLWAIALAAFVIAWIGQFIGHKIEGKKPSFFKDLQFLLIGPAWLLSFIYDKIGISYSSAPATPAENAA